eukprot:6966987-Pyramimonas_sp.AAC.1
MAEYNGKVCELVQLGKGSDDSPKWTVTCWEGLVVVKVGPDKLVPVDPKDRSRDRGARWWMGPDGQKQRGSAGRGQDG